LDKREKFNPFKDKSKRHKEPVKKLFPTLIPDPPNSKEYKNKYNKMQYQWDQIPLAVKKQFNEDVKAIQKALDKLFNI